MTPCSRQFQTGQHDTWRSEEGFAQIIYDGLRRRVGGFQFSPVSWMIGPSEQLSKCALKRPFPAAAPFALQLYSEYWIFVRNLLFTDTQYSILQVNSARISPPPVPW